jgi:AmiR/NasT family two-component response regulator
LRILLADEDKEALDSLATLVRALGHEVTPHAVSSIEAAEVIAETDPDLSMVALHRDDDHALGLIEEISAYADGPVIALLNSENLDFIARAAEGGVHAFAHPITGPIVQGAIEVATRRHAEAERLSEKVDQLESALERRAVIERAKGILMERHRIDDREAFELLRRHARSNNQKVVDVARAVADGHALLPRG